MAQSTISSFILTSGIMEHFPSINHLLEIQMMQKNFNEFKLFTAVEDLPKECYPELQEIFESNLDPCLKGSLHATINDLQHREIYTQ